MKTPCPRSPEREGRLAAVAEKERRNLANMIEMMIRDYCEKAGIPHGEESRSHRPAYNYDSGQ